MNSGALAVFQTAGALLSVWGSQLGDAASALDPSEVSEKICKAVLGDNFDQEEATGIDSDTQKIFDVKKITLETKKKTTHHGSVRSRSG